MGMVPQIGGIIVVELLVSGQQITEVKFGACSSRGDSFWLYNFTLCRIGNDRVVGYYGYGFAKYLTACIFGAELVHGYP